MKDLHFQRQVVGCTRYHSILVECKGYQVLSVFMNYQSIEFDYVVLQLLNGHHYQIIVVAFTRLGI